MSGERDDVQGEQIEILWDAEIGARVLEEDAWSRVGKPPASPGCPGHCGRRKIEAPFAPRLHLRDPRAGRSFALPRRGSSARGARSRRSDFEAPPDEGVSKTRTKPDANYCCAAGRTIRGSRSPCLHAVAFSCP